eukprot:102818-Pyramimonas_sp.AAC.1
MALAPDLEAEARFTCALKFQRPFCELFKPIEDLIAGQPRFQTECAVFKNAFAATPHQQGGLRLALTGAWPVDLRPTPPRRKQEDSG